jgi:hypothetical protein
MPCVSHWLQSILVYPAIKAAARARMAGRALWLRDNPNGILITVNAHIDNVQDIAAAFTLLPKPLTAARVKYRSATLDAFGECLGVHMRHHQ